MPQFPVEQYLQAFKDKYAQEDKSKNAFGQGLGAGMTQGIVDERTRMATEAKAEKDSASELLKIINDKYDIVRTDRQPLQPAEYMGVMTNFKNGKQTPGYELVSKTKVTPPPKPKGFGEFDPYKNTYSMGGKPVDPNAPELQDKDMTWNKIETNKPPTGSASADKDKRKATIKVYETVAATTSKNQMIDDALGAISKLPTGILGKGEMKLKELFSPNDPMLAEWQKVKSALTSGQLNLTSLTKGAISDYEMKLLSNAAANDNIGYAPKIKAALETTKRMLQNELDGVMGAYRQTYQEDPMQWDDIKAFRQPMQQPAAPPQQSALPQGISEEDIQFTMQKRGMTREQVLQKLGGR